MMMREQNHEGKDRSGAKSIFYLWILQTFAQFGII